MIRMTRLHLINWHNFQDDIIDFKNITFMDSSGIGLVMGRFRLMQNHHGSVEIRNVTPQTKKIMELAGLGRIAVINEIKEA